MDEASPTEDKDDKELVELTPTLSLSMRQRRGNEPSAGFNRDDGGKETSPSRLQKSNPDSKAESSLEEIAEQEELGVEMGAPEGVRLKERRGSEPAVGYFRPGGKFRNQASWFKKLKSKKEARAMKVEHDTEDD
jgi:hypothetical protein